MWTKVQLNWGTASWPGGAYCCRREGGFPTAHHRPGSAQGLDHTVPIFATNHPTDRPVTTNFPSKRTFAHLHTQAASLLTQWRTLLFVQIWQRNSLSFHWTFWRDFSFWGHSGLEPEGAVRSLHARCESNPWKRLFWNVFLSTTGSGFAITLSTCGSISFFETLATRTCYDTPLCSCFVFVFMYPILCFNHNQVLLKTSIQLLQYPMVRALSWEFFWYI